MVLGHGGVTLMHEATGMARSTIGNGQKEILSGGIADFANTKRQRKSGGGRKKLVEIIPGLTVKIKNAIEAVTNGNPMKELLYKSKSLVNLVAHLAKDKVYACCETIRKVLKKEGYSTKANCKCIGSKKNPTPKEKKDRNTQFNTIQLWIDCMKSFGQPAVSGDSKKKELVGQYANKGEEWTPKGSLCPVNDHDFPVKGSIKAVPYGIYDIVKNVGWVNLGISYDTSEFVLSSLIAWWQNMGIGFYPTASMILFTFDGGGSNGYRTRLFKICLQKFANATGLAVRVMHYPPGTSKWNKIEHRMFSFISKNWRANPLTSLLQIAGLICNTTTKEGLKIGCSIDQNT
jgi:hypothetical protein